MEGPWGTGSKEAVNLVFNEEVWAILGSHDGRNAHLVEQVIAKTHIVFLSAWATDPTLYQAFVPWFFSIVPNDDQQAEILAKEIIHTNKRFKIAALSDQSYDSNLALQSFIKKMSKMEYSEIIQLNYNNTDKNFKEITQNIDKHHIDCVVLFGEISSMFPLIQQLENNKNIKQAYGALSLLANDGQKEMNFKQFQNISIISYPNRPNNKKSSFIKSYKEKYGKIPGAVATYAYDGMNLILEVIQNSNFDREKVQKTMSKIKFNGVTGLIQFDEHGSRLNTAELIHISDRIPVIKEN
jgi:branched-chain amino acid transport system substrate-binding protein